MLISSYLLFIFISINWFLIFTPFLNFIQLNFFLIFTSFLSFLLLLNHPFSDGFEFGLILQLDSYSLLTSSILTLFFIGYLYTLFNTSVSVFKELPLLFLIIYFGFNTLMVSNDLIILYLSIELFSLTFYLITTIHQNYYTTEAAIKYFIYNFLAGAFYLLGSVLLYSETGSLNFLYLTQLTSGYGMELGSTVGYQSGIVELGWVFILISFLFKLSIAPFHFWTPDVYQGVLYPITAFFTIFPKYVIMIFMVKFYTSLLSSIPAINYLLTVCGLLSIFIGGFGALTQYNIKRLFAYSAVFNSGFLITLIALGTPNSYKILMVYLLAYLLANLGLFTILTYFSISNILGFKDIIGLGTGVYNKKEAPQGRLMAILLSLPVLSLAGLPPFIGFIAKFLTIYVLLGSNLAPVALFALIASIISLFYYLRFVHYALFYELPANPSHSPISSQHAPAHTNLKSIFSKDPEDSAEGLRKKGKRPTIYQSHIIAFINLSLLFLTLNPSFIFLIASVFATSCAKGLPF